MIIILDLNTFVFCDHVELKHFEEGKIKPTIMTQFLKFLSRIKTKTTDLYLPNKQYELVNKLSKLVHQHHISGIPEHYLLFFTSTKFKEYGNIKDECGDLSGSCKDDYKRICSAIVNYLEQQLIAITCLDKTFSRERLMNLLDEKRCRDKCDLELVRNESSSNVYLLVCNLDDRENIGEDLRKTFIDD
jgi:hypothetical protein